MNRRAFFQLAATGAVGVIATAMLPALPVDPYGEEFFSRVHRKAEAIVKREGGRAIRRMEIRAPEMKSGAIVRHVLLTLDAGSSLLDRCCFSWWQTV